MERTIVDEAKVAEHSRFTCMDCRRKIKKGLPVLRKAETTKYGFQSHSFCHRCAERQFKESKDVVAQMVKTLDEVEKKYLEVKSRCSKALILETFEYKEEEKKRELAMKKDNEEWIKRQQQWEKEREDSDKELEEFRKWKKLRRVVK